METGIPVKQYEENKQEKEIDLTEDFMEPLEKEKKDEK